MRRSTLFFIAVFLFVAAGFTSAAPSAEEILARADQIRAPSGDAIVKTRVVSSRSGRADETAIYEVLLKGQNRTIIKTLSPATEHGTSLLMLDHDLWVFLPDVSKPVRIALQQRLTGEVANGDLARANFSGDYTARVIEDKSTFYTLLLKAKSEDVTYGQVKLWIEKATFRPIRAAFYAFSGKLLKVGSYEDFRPMAGGVRPSRLVFTDALDKKKVSTLYCEWRQPENPIPDKYFTKDYLKKFKY